MAEYGSKAVMWASVEIAICLKSEFSGPAAPKG